MRPARGGLLRLAPALTLCLMAGPVLAGLAGTVLPAFGMVGPDGQRPFAALVGWPGLPRSMMLSLLPGLLATAISLAVTLLLLAALQGTRGFRLLLRLLSPLLAVPHAAAALGLAFLIAPSGWIARLLSPWATGWTQPPDLLILNDPLGLAMVAGLVSKEVPFLLLLALAALPQTDAPRRMLVAASLGRGRVAAFLTTVCPALYPQLRLPVLAVLAYSMTAADIGIVLGPSLPPPLSVQITRWMTDPDLSHRSLAAAGAILQLALVAMGFALWHLGVRGAARLLRHLAMAGWRGAGIDGPARPVAAGMGLLVAGGLLAGLLGLTLWSFAGLWQFPDALPHSLSLMHWTRALPVLADPLTVTLTLGLASALIALGLTLACLEAGHRFGLRLRAGTAWLLYLPLIVPQVVFLPGLQVLAVQSGVHGTWTATLIAHLTFVLPYVYLSLAPAWAAWDGRIATTAATLGASDNRIFWTLRLPMLLRAVLTAAAIGLAVSVGQYLPTLLISAGRLETLTTEAVALSSGGNRRLIGAYALLQMLVPALAFALAVALPALLFRHRRGLAVPT